jgi:hypothetical protein
MILDRMTAGFLLLFSFSCCSKKRAAAIDYSATFRDDPERAGATDTAAESCADDILLAP